jgi:transmembrane sensor
MSARTKLHTDFRYGRRIVALDQGEAFFSVAKDHGRPFLVETPLGTVRVTGTVFDIRLADPKDADVTLMEGSISLERPATEPLKLKPTEQVSISGADSSVRTLSSSELENISAWREGRVVFSGLTLSQVAQRLAAYFGSPIVVAPEVVNLQPGGSAPLQDLKSVLGALEEALPIRVISLDDGSYQLQPR